MTDFFMRMLDYDLKNCETSSGLCFDADLWHGCLCSFQRPLLVLVDRNVDLATPLHHTWTYQALTHDVLNLSLNRITLTEQDSAHPTARTKTKEYDLNDVDTFWAAHKGISMLC